MEAVSLAARTAYNTELDRLREAGTNVAAYSCRSFPSAVLAGLGLRPVRLPVEAGNSTRVPVRDDICPLINQLAAGILEQKPRVMVGMHTCDMTRRFYQEAERLYSISIHQLQLPATPGDASADFFAAQVERISADIILGGITPRYSEKDAESWFRGMIRGRELLESMLLTVPPVALQYFFHLFRVTDPHRAVKIISELTANAEPFRGKFTLLLTGSPVIPGDDTAAGKVEEAGGCLIPVNCTGLQMFPDSLPEDFSAGSIAKEFFHSGGCIRRRPNSTFFDRLSDSLKSTGADGVVLKTLPFCDLWYTEKVRLKEFLSVPMLLLDSSFATGEEERISMRMEAFMQSLVRHE